MHEPWDRVAIVTGAANGIGLATARQLAQEGYRVGLLDMQAQAVSARASALGAPHIGLMCYVSDESSVQSAVARVMAAFGRIDALVNNAGIGDQTGPTLAQNLAAFDRVLAVHVRGTFLMSQAVAGIMLQTNPELGQQRGAIVNLG